MKGLWNAVRLMLANLRGIPSAAPIAPPPMEIGTEAPIRTKGEDRLRRVGYAYRIADVLSELSPREGRVFAIRGGWGFGKSSLKHLVIEQLEARDKHSDWLDFNPWQWGDGNAISRALFAQIADKLGGDNSQEALKRAATLRKYGAILSGANAPLKQAGGSQQKITTILTNASLISFASSIGFDLPSAATVAGVLAGITIAISLLGRWLSHMGRDRSNESLDQVRKALEERLRELKRPLIVFVDDIDRLEQDQIRVLLRQVKANANLPNIVFVLLFQPSIVESALDPVADGDGRAFLEKIVQASFDLPMVPTHMVHRIFTENLSQLANAYASEKNGFEQIRWGNALIGSIQPRLRNMRDAHRLLSSVAVHLPLHASGDLLEVNIVDFLVLETLRVFEADLHEALFREKTLLLQEGKYRGDGRPIAQAAMKDLLSTVPEERRELAKETIELLFPQVEWVMGGPRYDHGFQQQWAEAKQVCTSRFFPRYFELQTALGEISERRFTEFLDAALSEEQLSALIAVIEADGLLPALVARLDESVNRLPVANASVLLPGLFAIAQKLVGHDGDPFSSPWVRAWRATSWFLKYIPEDKRGGLAIEALRETKALSVAVMLIHLSDPVAHKNKANFEPTLDLPTVEAMKAIWLQLVRSRAADNNALLGEPDLASLLHRWKNYSGSLDQPRRWLLSAIGTDQEFAIMASSFMSVGTSHVVGDRVGTVQHMFSRETIETFVGLDNAIGRCESINPADFPGYELPLTTLQRHLEAWVQNKGELLDW
ncbi:MULTISPECIES: P-loop NTPase fold protein [Pseudomonas]|uniref:KAP family P-loop NTPase fold protein n=1 Tax=Pseudomonas TaxID=286 RepID=UPI000B35D4A1|nr:MULTISPECIES: P-loop NTPase fold protein [Pseudomonas]PMY68487.1 NTPase [Pseudomonas sp. FW305-25]PMY73956.1 NTPase [Pseudomonas sp. FW126-L8]PNA82628.1 NTPase [Pseudomonas sp. FW305-76]